MAIEKSSHSTGYIRAFSRSILFNILLLRFPWQPSSGRYLRARKHMAGKLHIVRSEHVESCHSK